MARIRLTEKDLRNELDDIGVRYPKLADHERFVVWFLRALVTDNEAEAVSALTGHSGDKECDAVLIDDRARLVIVVQGKYREEIGKGSEARNDVLGFAQVAAEIHGSDSEFRQLTRRMDGAAKQKLTEARERVTKRHYRLKLYYATLGKCAKDVIEDAVRVCRRAGAADLEVCDGKRVLLALDDYLDGVAPPIPSLDLPMEIGKGVQSGSHFRHDEKNGITAWLFSMNASAVAEMYEQTGVRLFARNVRGYLGNTEINRGMEETLEHEPWHFWYYNNGITIVCDRAERVGSGGREVMRVTNPQVINGQQTTRTLHVSQPKNTAAAVLVRVIVVPRDGAGNSEEFERLVSRIVAATNWQNEIRPSDLMANDRRQIQIERELRKFDYLYVRKRQAGAETRRTSGVSHWVVAKEQLAQAVAACELDPHVVRSGKERLFEEQLYPKIFPTADPYFYLTRFRLMKEVGFQSRDYPERAYAKWLVLHYVWAQLEPLIRSRSNAFSFIQSSQSNSGIVGPLSSAIIVSFRAALAFFRKNRGKGETATDISTFFRRRGLVEEFTSFLRGSGRAYRRSFEKYWARVQKEIATGSEPAAKTQAAHA